MLSLIVKGIEFEDELLSFSKKEHKSPEYLAIAPRGKVPALVDGDFVLTESLAIVMYIDRKFPSPPLFGETAEEAGRIAQRIQEHEHYLGKAALDVMGPIFRGQATDRADELRSKSGALRDELSRFDALFTDAPWIGGQRVSAADIVLYPTVCLIDRMARRPDLRELDLGIDPLETHHPRLAEFQRRFAALPGVARAHPPHWNA